MASAFIKSMRGSDPDAAIYWLARMLEAGEDPRFIARRVVICASEDVGNADPQALVVAAAALQAVEFVGLPECQLPPGAGGDVPRDGPEVERRDAGHRQGPRGRARRAARCRCRSTCATPTTTGPKQLGHGEGYKYSHDYEGGLVDQEYLPEERRYYEPTDRGYEAVLRQRLAEWRNKKD